MLVRLTAKQISDYWGSIGPAIEAALPPIVYESKERVNNVLASLLKGQMQCWTIWSVDGKVAELKGVVVTTVVEDSCSRVRSLLIYSLYTWKPVSNSLWKDSFEIMRKYACGLKCNRIVAYTKVKRLIDLVVNDLGGKAEFTFLTMEVGHEATLHSDRGELAGSQTQGVGRSK